MPEEVWKPRGDIRGDMNENMRDRERERRSSSSKKQQQESSPLAIKRSDNHRMSTLKPHHRPQYHTIDQLLRMYLALQNGIPIC